MVPKQFRGIFAETVLKAPRRSGTIGTAPDKAGQQSLFPTAAKAPPQKMNQTNHLAQRCALEEILQCTEWHTPVEDTITEQTMNP